MSIVLGGLGGEAPAEPYGWPSFQPRAAQQQELRLPENLSSQKLYRETVKPKNQLPLKQIKNLGVAIFPTRPISRVVDHPANEIDIFVLLDFISERL